MENDYDPTAGTIYTPAGAGRYIGHDAANGLVYVEIEHKYIMVFKSRDCYLD